MSGGSRPPLPGLIPLADLFRRPRGRPRKRQESIDEVSGAISRFPGAHADATPGIRRQRSRRACVIGISKQKSRSSSPSVETPPRVNPIFVWVQQEDTRIVDVKCEDYDKRNRILLTKTAHGWRAIPRTEMLSAPRASADEESPSNHHHHHHHHHHHRHHRKKNRKIKHPQFPEIEHIPEPAWVTSENINIESLLPSHTIPIKRSTSSEHDLMDISAKQVRRPEFVRTTMDRSASDKISEVSPLENLLAVAELELKQHMEEELWKSANAKNHTLQVSKNFDAIDVVINENSNTNLILSNDDKSLDSTRDCSYNDDDDDDGMSMNDILTRLEQSLESPQGYESNHAIDHENIDGDCNKIEHKICDEQSIKNKRLSDEQFSEPVCEVVESTDGECCLKSNNKNMIYERDSGYEAIEPIIIQKTSYQANDETLSGIAYNSQENDALSTDFPGEFHKDMICTDDDQELYFNKKCEVVIDTSKIDEKRSKCEVVIKIELDSNNHGESNKNNIEVGFDNSFLNPLMETLCDDHIDPHDTNSGNRAEPSSTILEEGIDELMKDDNFPTCLDLSIRPNPNPSYEIDHNNQTIDLPTDLCIRDQSFSQKNPLHRPPSQSSETTIQSPQPSGIPAVPVSPDISSSIKSKSVFLDSLSSSNNAALRPVIEGCNSEDKDILDLAHHRESPSPTVTCSEEIVRLVGNEPIAKKAKWNDVTVKKLLTKNDLSVNSCADKNSNFEHLRDYPATPAFYDVNTSLNEPTNAVAEYRQLLQEINLPDPLVVPRDIFLDLLKHPRQEILKILRQPNKNMNMEKMIVIYQDKLIAALENYHMSEKISLNIEGVKTKLDKETNLRDVFNYRNKIAADDNSKQEAILNKNTSIFSENVHQNNSLAEDIDAANEAALNSFFTTGCPNPFEVMNNYGNYAEFVQAMYAASSMPYFGSQIGEMHPGLQIMLANNLPLPFGFASMPQANFDNPLKLSMWQDAVLQANLLRENGSYENSPIGSQLGGQQNASRRTHYRKWYNPGMRCNTRMPNNILGFSNNNIGPQQVQPHILIGQNFGQSSLNNPEGWQSPYLSMSNISPNNGMPLDLPLNQFNLLGHKNNLGPVNKYFQQHNPTILNKRHKEMIQGSMAPTEQGKKTHPSSHEQQKKHHFHQHKLSRQQAPQQQHLPRRHLSEPKPTVCPGDKRTKSFPDPSQFHGTSKHYSVATPIDLSGAQSVHHKSNQTRLPNCVVSSTRSSLDDVPEVGSTTENMEEFADGYSQFWHPLFGRYADD